MTGLLLTTLLTAGSALADDGGRAERLAELRSEVEALQHEVSMDKADMRTRLQALEAARTELELQVRQEELELQQLRLEIEKERALAAEAGADHQVLVPAVKAGLDRIRPVIEGGLPYRVPERLEAVREIEVALEGGTLPPHKAANRLWSLYEDELRLGRENALDRQTITLGGQQVLVDVARLGMVALFFRTSAGATGWAERAGSGWTWRTADARADRQQILALFDALEKQMRVGWFEIPNVLPGAE
jgi:hypothetical protein